MFPLRYFLTLILPLVGIFTIGALAVASTEITLLPNQLIYYSIGILIILVFTFVDSSLIQKFSPAVFIAILLLLILVLVLGEDVRGSVRWFDFGSFRLQPSELAKPAMIFFLAAFFTMTQHLSKKIQVVLSLVLTIIPFTLIFIQPDLGSAMPIILIWFSMIFIKGFQTRYIIALILLIILTLPIGWTFLAPYQKERINTFLNPTQDPLGAGYAVIQSQISIGSGQFLGKGLTRGTQSQLDFLPEKHTDFVFASIAEEVGFVGSFLIILGFLVLISSIFYYASLCRDIFSVLVLISAASLILFQFFVSVGMNLGLLPVTGITLPFISYGGSSVLSLCLILGVVNGVIVQNRLYRTQ